VATATQVQGKELSYNNINDTDAALSWSPSSTRRPACAIIKHANPCGVATGATLAEAYAAPWPATRPAPSAASSPSTAAGRRDRRRAITEIFTEVVIAPDADEEAVAVFAAKKNLRLLVTGACPIRSAPTGWCSSSVAGGFLVQTATPPASPPPT
jgi:phosphoribosylaminoimidazolecarboxamide formyltransferase/IMP cyclohydrolase